MVTRLRLGARVEGKESENFGTLKYLAIDPQTSRLTSLVVSRAGFSTDEVVVDVTRATDISEDGGVVIINVTEDEFTNLPLFIERLYSSFESETATGSEGLDGTLSSSRQEGGGGFSIQDRGIPTSPDKWYTPESGVDEAVPLFTPNQPGSENASFDSSVEDSGPVIPLSPDLDGPAGRPVMEKMNVPENSLIFREGSEVEALDGKVGHLKEVELDSMSRIVSDLILEKGFFFTHEFIVPFELVQNTSDMRIYLNVTKSEFEKALNYESEGNDLDSNGQQ